MRNITLEDYGISDERYRELKHFCLQYADKKKTASRGSYGIKGKDYLRTGSLGGFPWNMTEKLAVLNVTRQEHARRDCKRMEEAARRAANAGGYPEDWESILLSVTDGLSYESILANVGYLPWSKTDFYAVRRAFYYWIDVLQHDD